MSDFFRFKKLSWILLTMAFGINIVLVVAFQATAWSKPPILMRTSFDDPHAFDATKWFQSGMYQRRRLAGRVFDDEISMTRVRPPAFGKAQNLGLCDGIVVAWKRLYPKLDTSGFLENCPDLIHRTFYVASGFSSPETPEDHYHTYVSFRGQRWIVDIVRDGVSGKIVHVSDVIKISTSDLEDTKIFEHLEAAERAQVKSPASIDHDKK